MRRQIGAAAQQGLPEGYEDLVGAYYKALSAGPAMQMVDEVMLASSSSFSFS